MPVDQPAVEPSSYITQAYPRYGGLVQTQPLTADEQKYDDTCREIDQLEVEIGGKSMALFTAAEYMWFHQFVTKMHFFPKQDRLDRQLHDLKNLMAKLQEREAR